MPLAVPDPIEAARVGPSRAPSASRGAPRGRAGGRRIRRPGAGARRQRAERRRPARGDAARPGPIGVPPALRRHAGRRVLVVEDNAVNRQIAGELLGNAGLLVDMAEDGLRALASLAVAPAGHYDLVLMKTLQMPQLDGHDTALKRSAQTRATCGCRSSR